MLGGVDVSALRGVDGTGSDCYAGAGQLQTAETVAASEPGFLPAPKLKVVGQIAPAHRRSGLYMLDHLDDWRS